MPKPDKKTPVLEWIAAGAGAVMLAAFFGVIGYAIATGGEKPPAFEFDTLESTKVGEKYLVAFRIRNTGDITAATVTVVAEANHGSGDFERSQTTLRYVPSSSTRNGGVYFSRDPGISPVRFRVAGYELP